MWGRREAEASKLYTLFCRRKSENKENLAAVNGFSRFGHGTVVEVLAIAQEEEVRLVERHDGTD